MPGPEERQNQGRSFEWKDEWMDEPAVCNNDQAPNPSHCAIQGPTSTGWLTGPESRACREGMLHQAVLRFLATPAKASRPEPNSQAAAGTGTVVMPLM